MRASASLENAQRHLTALRRAAARLRPRDLAKVVGGVAAVLFCLALLYLGIANAILRTQLIQRSVSGAEGFDLRFGSAYTLWPGHVVVRDLSLRFEDYNVQFELGMQRAELDIALSELAFKKFRVTELDADGTHFRLRHKVIAVGDDAERIAAFPPIRGFADPPYYVGVRPPPSTGPAKQLWQVRIERVNARVRELWIMEYRFAGAGVARGSFVVQPTRWVQVEPAQLELHEGRLTLGRHLVAERMSGRISCDVPDMWVQKTHGREVLREISSSVRLQLESMQLDFLEAYLARLGAARYGGSGRLGIDLNLVRGVVQPGTHLELRATPFEARYDGAVAAGDLLLELVHPSPGAFAELGPHDLLLSLTAPRIALERADAGAKGPQLDTVKGSVVLHAADLTGEMALGKAQLSVARASAPSLAWFNDRDLKWAGSAEASLSLARDDQAVTSGRVELRARRAELRRGDFAARADLLAKLGFERRRTGRATVEPLAVQLEALSLTQGKRRSQPTNLSVRSARMQVDPASGWATQALVDVHVASSRALLPLLVGEPLKELTAAALQLRSLQGRVALELGQGGAFVQVIDARSGNLRLRGYLRKRSSEPRGAFLLSSGPLNVGVTLANGSTEVSPLVGDDWLANAWARVAAPHPGAG